MLQPHKAFMLWHVPRFAMLLIVCLSPERGSFVAFRYSLGWIGRKTRRECAKELTRQLKETLDIQDVASAMVTDLKHLDAFRDRPFGRPMNELLHHLKRRIQDELTPHRVLITSDYTVRGGRLYHLTIEATSIRTVDQRSR